jgi:hypothetical protein
MYWYVKHLSVAYHLGIQKLPVATATLLTIAIFTTFDRDDSETSQKMIPNLQNLPNHSASCFCGIRDRRKSFRAVFATLGVL